jgi:hypothetical protein
MMIMMTRKLNQTLLLSRQKLAVVRAVALIAELLEECVMLLHLV